MSLKSDLASSYVADRAPFVGSAPCECLAEFFRQELRKHHACLEQQREYYSEDAIGQAEAAIAKLMTQLEVLCQREDACRMMGELLRKFDLVTKLSAWTDSNQLH
jgi:hypothetical protein